MSHAVSPVEPCVLCGEPIDGHVHNAEPLREGRCCDPCNARVIKYRLKEVFLDISRRDGWNQ